MNTIKIASALLVSLVAVACAAPTEDPTQQQPASSEEDGKTAQEKEELMRGGGLGESCSVTCSSQDKLQTCCCSGTNVKCISNVASCQCSDATRFGGGVIGNGGVIY
jgi:hypothetical protein